MRKTDLVTAVSAGLLGLLALGVVYASIRPVSRQVASADKPAPPALAARPGTPQAAASPAASPTPADPRFVIKRILPIKGPIKYGEWHWDEKGVPEGPIAITVDLEARVISVFRGGYEIGAAAVLLGTQEKPTPTGVFPITQKRRDHTSSIYGAPMPFMQRLTDDGISLHATQVERGYASHGCIGMPLAFAGKVFSATKIGDKVYITRGQTATIGDSITGS